MKRLLFVFGFSVMSLLLTAQEVMTPELLWSLGRVSGKGISDDGKNLIYTVSTPDVEGNSFNRQLFSLAIDGESDPVELESDSSILRSKRLSPDGNYLLSTQRVAVNKVKGSDVYPNLPKSDVYIYESLKYRHWDTWEDGKFSHLFVSPVVDGVVGEAKDLMPDEPYDTPQKPFGGDEDFTWSSDSKTIVYVSKKEFGTEYAISTNTDLYAYDVATGITQNLTESNKGYDTHPLYSSKGTLAYLSMKTAGYEADKNSLMVFDKGKRVNLTEKWDGTIYSFMWDESGEKLYFIAPFEGTVQLFSITYPDLSKKNPEIKQLTSGRFDVSSIVGQTGNSLLVSRTDMNHAAEIYKVDIKNGVFTQLTRVNDEVFNNIEKSLVEKRFVTTTDDKKEMMWVIYPPNFDKTKKYPTLLYCQGGPQSALTHFYSFRWNFQLMAAQGYIVVAPNRRGMPGWGAAWNEAISKDWGGQVMEDYLTAIDYMMGEPFVDKERIGCVGASYGGYSVFYLAGIHENRFKSFIAHDGVFNLKSMYGTTEELFFVNHDIGGPYWDKSNKEAQKTYSEFDPSNMVDNWNTPMLIIQGGKDFRVPIGQGLEAFTAAQLKGLKSKLLYFPEENHWILSPQNGLVWQSEFFKWLENTL